MRKFFTPPEEFQGKLGDYRSVLTFDDGTPVKTPQDWPRRRKEILDYWHGAMEPWPALVEKPRIKYKQSEHVENFTRHEVEVEVAPGRFVGSQYLLIPDGEGPFPAVVVTWYGSADSAGLKKEARGTLDFGYQLAKRGFVALCIGNISQENAGGKGGIQPLSYLAYAAANCCNALANLSEVDPARIGIIGHSFGGKWAMFASCLHEGFACAVWIDPGIVWNEKDANANYWEKWYLGTDFNRPANEQRKEGIPKEGNPRTGAYKKLVTEGRDMHELHALMAPRPFLVSGGAQDRPQHWIALNHTIALNAFLGHSGRVAMTMRNGHTPTAESNTQTRAGPRTTGGRRRHWAWSAARRPTSTDAGSRGRWRPRAGCGCCRGTAPGPRTGSRRPRAPSQGSRRGR
jgi:dienelactone hydrolase